ncbi:winged-helix domain-containing protein [Streptomyces monticola]|uniref:Winged-helix domain-containing protein n=1 Tax=Streptomyces monticola TaxID=2666263 RepID=A0ABW2JDW4_9ACTN
MTPDPRRPPVTAASGSDGPAGGTSADLVLAEPDEELAARTAARFAAAGVTTLVCHDGAEALLQIGAHHPRMVLLGAPLPVVGAARVTELIAKLHPVPVLVGAGPGGAHEATAALAKGAVALVARPYRAAEILPLFSGGTAPAEPEQTLVVGDIELDAAGFHVHVRGRPLHLPVREFLLLRYLMERPNRVVSRQELSRALWGTDKPDSNTLTVHIRRVRNRLREGVGSRCTIDAIRGLGYRLECGPTARTGAPAASIRPAPQR